MINITGFYTSKTINKNTLEISQETSSKNAITPFAWFQYIKNYPYGLIKEDPNRPNINPQFNYFGYYDIDIPTYKDPKYEAPDYLNAYTNLIVAENTQTYDEFKAYIANEDNAKKGLEYFENYKLIANDSPISGGADSSDFVKYDFKPNKDYFTANNINYQNNGTDRISISPENRIIHYQNAAIRYDGLKEYLDSFTDDQKTSSEYLELLSEYNSYDENILPILISFQFMIFDEEEYNISTLATYDNVFDLQNNNNLNFIKSYSKLNTPIVKKSDEILILKYQQIVTIPLSTSTNLTIDGKNYIATCNINNSEFLYNLNPRLDKKFGIFTILEKFLAPSAAIMYDIPGIAPQLDINERIDGAIILDDSSGNYIENSKFSKLNKAYFTKTRDNLIKLSLSGYVDNNFYLAAEYGIKAINYGFFVLEFDTPIKSKNPLSAAELQGLITSNTSPKFNTFTDSSLNNAGVIDASGIPKLVKIPGITFSIPTDLKVSDIKKYEDLLKSYTPITPPNDDEGYYVEAYYDAAR